MCYKDMFSILQSYLPSATPSTSPWAWCIVEELRWPSPRHLRFLLPHWQAFIVYVGKVSQLQPSEAFERILVGFFNKDSMNTDYTDKTDIWIFINKSDLLNLFGMSSDKSDKFNLLTFIFWTWLCNWWASSHVVQGEQQWRMQWNYAVLTGLWLWTGD